MGDYIGNRCLDIMSLFLHFKIKITLYRPHPHTCNYYTYTPVSYALVHLYICTPKHLCTCIIPVHS